VLIVGTEKSEYPSKHGYPVKADISVKDTTADQFDAVVIPGGYAPDHLRRSQNMVKLVRDAAQQGKVVAAVCHAPWVLASAGLLEGRRATCFSSIKDDVINAGAHYEDAEVMKDGNVITSRQPSDLGAFCREIIQVLAD
jgi:protease I